MSIRFVAYVLVGGGLLFCAFLAGSFWGSLSDTVSQNTEQVFLKGGGELTNPLLECGLESREISIGKRAVIEEEVTSYVEKEFSRGAVTQASVYFRDLDNGPWFGIAERELFEPGSLLKLPIAISLYYWDSKKEDVLGGAIDLTEGLPLGATQNATSNASQSLVPPGIYTVRDLIGIMLRDSSNDAANILAQYEGEERMQRVFKDLGIEPPKNGQAYRTNVKTYGAFFRVLYNATYLGKEDSEEILKTLTYATFRSGLVAGVPDTVMVSHKYGTRVSAPGVRQLHDCGIVYARTPYILCVMSQGKSMADLENFIAGVSRRVYEGVQSLDGV